jgi:hypothetical protein
MERARRSGCSDTTRSQRSTARSAPLLMNSKRRDRQRSVLVLAAPADTMGSSLAA